MLESLLMDPVSERNKDSEANNLNETSEDFEEEQTLVAKLVHLVNNEDLEQNFKLLNKIRKHFGFGEKSRLRYTLPPTIFATFRLLHRYSANRQNIVIIILIKKNFAFVFYNSCFKKINNFLNLKNN